MVRSNKDNLKIDIKIVVTQPFHFLEAYRSAYYSSASIVRRWRSSTKKSMEFNFFI